MSETTNIIEAGAQWTARRLLAWLCTGAGLLTLAGLLLWGLIATLDRKQVSEVAVEAGPAPEVAHAPRVGVQVKQPVKVYTGDAKAELKLPPEVQANPNEYTLSATQVRGNDRPQTVITTINTDTGESRSFTKVDPYPWFAIETRGEARLSMGYKLRGTLAEPVVRLGVGYDVVRIKALTAGVNGTVDSDGDTFLGVGISYRW